MHSISVLPGDGWVCETCGAAGTTRRRSRESLTLAAMRHHGLTEPHHTPTYSVDEIGRHEWRCSCGAGSYATAHPALRFAQQAHTRHATRELLRWYRHQQVLEDRLAAASQEYQDRLERLSPEGRERVLARDLEEIL